MQGWFNILKAIDVICCINKLKMKNHMIISIDAKKSFDKTQRVFLIKTLSTLGIEGNFLQLSKDTYKTPLFMSYFVDEDRLPLRRGTGQGYMLPHSWSALY